MVRSRGITAPLRHLDGNGHLSKINGEVIADSFCRARIHLATVLGFVVGGNRHIQCSGYFGLRGTSPVPCVF